MRHKCLASFLVLCLYLAIILLIGFAEFKALVNPNTLLQTFRQSGIYENLPKYVEYTTLTSKDAKEDSKILISTIVKSINPEDIQKEVEKNLPPLLSYLNGQEQSLQNVNFDSRGIKKNLTENFPDQLAESLKDLPPCPAGVTPNPKSVIPECLPQGITIEQIQEQARNVNIAGELLKEIPDTYSLANLKNSDQIFSTAKLAFKVINIGFVVIVILNLILIGLLALLGRHWWPSILRWTGLGLVLPSGSILLLNLVAKTLPQLLTGKYTGQMDPEVLEFIKPLVESINTSTLAISFLYAGIIFALGSILIVLSYVLPHPPEPKPPAKQSAPAPSPTPTK